MTILNPALKLAYDDLAGMPEDGRRHELIDGEHYVTPAPTRKHQGIVSNLIFHFVAYLREHPIGWVYPAPLDVVLSDVDVVEPDLLFIARERAEILGDKFIGGAPDLVVEILSESTRRVDEVTKRKLYERFGVREYWVLDPVLDEAKVYVRSGEGFGEARRLSAEAGESLTTALLPGRSIPLVDLFG
jgi:Uma2 family endonuclease